MPVCRPGCRTVITGTGDGSQNMMGRMPTIVVRLFKEVVIIEYGEKETNMFSSMKIGIMGLEQES